MLRHSDAGSSGCMRNPRLARSNIRFLKSSPVWKARDIEIHIIAPDLEELTVHSNQESQRNIISGAKCLESRDYKVLLGPMKEVTSSGRAGEDLRRR